MRQTRRARGRRQGQREIYDRVLIVCEGERTESSYFKDLCHDLRISSAVVITGDSDPDPRGVVTYGLQKYREDGDFDRLYCVFDRDTHPESNFRAAKQQLRQARKQRIDAHWTVSRPCFEYWILLHYEYTARRYTSPSSPCSQVVKDVKQHISNYGKGMRGLYDETKPHLDTALERSRRRWKQAKGVGSLNPSTKVHKLITYLHNVRG
ncbi:MAG: RloB family protein [Bacteroidota bacterium]